MAVSPAVTPSADSAVRGRLLRNPQTAETSAEPTCALGKPSGSDNYGRNPEQSARLWKGAQYAAVRLSDPRTTDFRNPAAASRIPGLIQCAPIKAEQPTAHAIK